MKKFSALLAILLAAGVITGCGKIDLTDSKTDKNYSDIKITPLNSSTETSSEDIFVPDDNFVECEAAVCYDLNKDEIIYEKNLNKPIYPASLTKLLTALVAVKYLDSSYICTVGGEIEQVAEDSSRAWLSQGEKYMRDDLLAAMLVPSGNDAAYTVAANVVKKVYGNDISVYDANGYFSVLMNNYAADLGCTDTHFTVPDGYHDPEHVTTCADMLKIAAAAAKEPAITAITSTQLSVVYDLDGYTHSWENGNLLLTDPYIEYTALGLKTGYTDEAGFCFAGLAEKDGKKIITLAFGCGVEYRYEDTLKLMDLGFDLYDSRKDYEERLTPANSGDNDEK